MLCFTFVIGKLCVNIDPSVCQPSLPTPPPHTLLLDIGYTRYTKGN